MRPTRSARGSPELFDRVAALARDLWWTWNPDPQRLLAGLDPVAWEAVGHNPLAVLADLRPERRAALREASEFAQLLADCERQRREYLSAATWFERRMRGPRRRLRVAYFCAEFGLHECLPIYAGGLGVLAGDHLKSASDLGVPLVGVGLLYRNGYYRQEFRHDGSTRVTYPALDFERLPLTDTGRRVRVPLGRREIVVRIWRATVGRVPLYLLDTDVRENRPAERAITGRLYGGNEELRIRQEVVLGIGGVRALAELGERVTVFHMNEGHAAFCNLERLRQLRAAGMSVPAALRRVRRSSVFTTHTPVPAGHDRFPPRLMLRYFEPYLRALKLDPAAFLALGRERPEDRNEPFCMTVLALRTAGRCNGVARLHGAVSRAMWTGVFAVTDPRKVPITHITNGVHSQTWLAPEMRPLYDKYLRPRWLGAGPADNWWRRADRIPPAELWHVRNLLRRKLVAFVRARLQAQILRRCEPVSEYIAALETFDENALTIGFARRFATYKRAPLIFTDPARLTRILNDARRPVQLVFAGKAHPADAAGQAFAREIFSRARQGEFRGRVVILEDYDLHVGRVLTAGCDVWLNNPVRPQEASGTSGMKPPLHGGLNCSILDGWWPEAYDGRNGWAIGETAAARRGRTAIASDDARPLTPRAQAARDRVDAASLYAVLEREIVPLFYTRDRAGIPQGWVRRMIHSMQTVCGRFNTHRMLAEYVELYSGPNA